MSFDLMVFEPTSAPRTPREFFAWYERQIDWRDDRTYDDPGACAEALRAWFLEMIVDFPAAGGPHASDADSSRLSDYSIDRDIIYAAFPWSQADEAFERASALAIKYRLGIFKPSSMEGPVRFPEDPGFDANPPPAKP